MKSSPSQAIARSWPFRRRTLPSTAPQCSRTRRAPTHFRRGNSGTGSRSRVIVDATRRGSVATAWTVESGSYQLRSASFCQSLYCSGAGELRFASRSASHRDMQDSAPVPLQWRLSHVLRSWRNQTSETTCWCVAVRDGGSFLAAGVGNLALTPEATGTNCSHWMVVHRWSRKTGGACCTNGSIRMQGRSDLSHFAATGWVEGSEAVTTQCTNAY